TMAGIEMIAEWASRTGSAVCDAVSNQPLNPIPIRPQKEKGAERRRRKNIPIPITTKNPVQKRPRSSTAAPELSTKSSGFAQWLHIQLGTGASTYVATTSSG